MAYPYLSICVPIYEMPDKEFFLRRCFKSLEMQTFQDFEVVMTEEGKMAENTNAAIKKSKGELIKILYMDDYLAHDNALALIVENFQRPWLVTGCNHEPGDNPHFPSWNKRIIDGVNTIGSPSVLTVKNEDPLLFDENLGWLLDCDYYWRLYQKFGSPIYLNDINVTIGVGEHQATNLMGDQIKIKEQQYLYEKYSSSPADNR